MRENPSGNRKLTDEQAVAVRLAYARGYKSSYQLAREYGMTQAGILSVVQGSCYKQAGGPITWPDGSAFNQRPLPRGAVRGRCRDVACRNPIASSGWAQRMHLCESCFRINGGKDGRKATGKEITAICHVCGAPFTYYKTVSVHRRKCCSVACGAALSATVRQKRPTDLTDELLYELYWGRDLTTAEISKRYGGTFTKDAVRLWLIEGGIARRRSTARTYSTCRAEGCVRTVHKLWNGHVWYGRLCKEHLRDRDARRSAFYKEQVTSERGAELSSEIGKLLAGLPDSVRADIHSDLLIAVLSGELAPPLTRASVKPYIAKGFRENADAWKFLSLAAPAGGGDEAQTWGERLGLV